MTKRELYRRRETATAIRVSDLERYGAWWLADGEMRQLSPETLKHRRITLGCLAWWLRDQEHESLGEDELRAFGAYLAGPAPDGGRWGRKASRGMLRPGSVATYQAYLRSLLDFLEEEGVAEGLAGVLRPPRVLQEQIRPYSEDEQEAIVRAAQRSRDPVRDEAIVMLLLDTGVRAAEVCGLLVRDVDLRQGCAVVKGKGNKRRTVYFDAEAKRALWRYLALREDPEPEQPLFIGSRGQRAGEALQPRGLWKLVNRLGKVAGVVAARCSPHTFRHTFAVEFLRAGGNAPSLQRMMGHTNLAMTNRYLALAQADMQQQHRQFSPANRLKKRMGRGRK